jgi:hypothetical protein
MRVRVRGIHHLSMAKPSGYRRTDLRKTLFHPRFGPNLTSRKTNPTKIYRSV